MSTKLLNRSRWFLLVTAVAIFCFPIKVNSQELKTGNKTLPSRFGDFRRVAGVQAVERPGANELKSEFAAPNRARLSLSIYSFEQEGRAYQFFTVLAQSQPKDRLEIGSAVGTSSFITSRVTAFFKGRNVVEVSGANTLATGEDRLALATEVAQQLDRGDGEIPVLVKHLPNWEQAQQTAIYLNRFESFQPHVNDPVLSAVNSGRDADAVLAHYGPMRLLIIEFNTPQRAAENDQRIIARIRELWNSGQPAPSAYRRVGNYSVFVFDAPDEQAAKQLIDQVRYEQVVSWLGENPNILKEAERQYVQTTLGVLIMVLKASGFALITCFGSGALFGALLFRWRRAQQRTSEAFSDAGGMLRLNLDEMTPQTNPARLLRPQ